MYKKNYVSPKIFVVLAINFLNSPLLLAESCSDILVNGVFDQYESTHSYSDAFALKEYICNKEIGSKNRHGNGSGRYSANFLNTISAAMGGSGSHSSQSSFERENCNASDLSHSTSNAESILRRVASQDILKTWERCIQSSRRSSTGNRGLACTLHDQNPNDKYVHIRIENLDPYNELINVRTNTSNLVSVEGLQQRLGHGSIEISARIANANSSAVLNINADKWENGYYNHISCKVDIPKPNFSSYDSSCATDHHPVEEILYNRDILKIKRLLDSNLNIIEIRADHIYGGSDYSNYGIYGKLKAVHNKEQRSLKINIRGSFYFAKLESLDEIILLTAINEINFYGGAFIKSDNIYINADRPGSSAIISASNSNDYNINCPTFSASAVKIESGRSKI